MPDIPIIVDKLTEEIEVNAKDIAEKTPMSQEDAEVYLLKEIMYVLDIQKYFIIR